MTILAQIEGPEDLKKLSPKNLLCLAEELRQEIIRVTSQNGGHIGPNLGVVELTIALHCVFSTPKDQILFDVSHQGYVHKLLTGRYGSKFEKIRMTGGLSGFLSREESEHDAYGAGHAGTALSAALGMAKARDLLGKEDQVVAVIGDGALTCGITMEAMNNISCTTGRLTVVLNDNEWSIAKNVGAISRYLNELITNPLYNRLHKDLESFLKKIPGGNRLLEWSVKARREAKDFFLPSSLFEKYGLRYLGPIDGHNLPLLIQYLEFCKQSDQPIILHIITTKGKGYDVALKNPEKFHGASPFDVKTGKAKPAKKRVALTYQEAFGGAITRFARENKKVIGITAAMSSGTGLSQLATALPGQFFDVGIAEEHAVLFAAGMATKGFRPVCAIYSTFLQRAYDPIIHDVCLQNLPVVFCMDRAGLSPNDGPTHHGLFDIAFLRSMPRAVIMQPKDEEELSDMLYTSLCFDGPSFIRYPRGVGEGVLQKKYPRIIPIAEAECLREGSEVAIWALGPMVREALIVAERLQKSGISVGVVNARFAKPLDMRGLLADVRAGKIIVTMEDHVVCGGFGSAVLEALNEAGLQVPLERIGWPDLFIRHGSSVEDLRRQYGLSTEEIEERIKKCFEKSKAFEYCHSEIGH